MGFLHEGAGYLFAGVFVTCALLAFFRKDERGMVALLAFIFIAATLVIYFSRSRGEELSGASYAYIAYRLGQYFQIIAVISIAGMAFFRGLAPAFGFASPRILQDVVVAVAYIVFTILFLQLKIGWNVAGVVATSAVLTAVVGLSLQDTLGNILAGLAIQIDKSIHKGDWIKIDDLVGKVNETSWRYTSIETRNWETVLIPNSALMKNRFLVLGRREGEPVQWRRWVYFNVDFRTPPKKVIDAVSETVRGAAIPHVAAKPEPNCVMMDFTESYGRYALRYWLTDLAVDDPTDSEVRGHIYVALQRAGIPFSMPAHAVFLTQETAERKTTKATQALAHRRVALQHIELFHTLQPDELDHLTERLVPAPFAKGDVITRQGAEAHWLYILADGSVDVLVNRDGESRKISQVGPGQVFGEIGLMTGEPRTATMVAATDVECFKLDKESFRHILETRPEVAEGFSHILARRRADLDHAVGDIDAEMHARHMADSQKDILGKIKKLFGL